MINALIIVFREGFEAFLTVRHHLRVPPQDRPRLASPHGLRRHRRLRLRQLRPRVLAAQRQQLDVGRGARHRSRGARGVVCHSHVAARADDEARDGIEARRLFDEHFALPRDPRRLLLHGADGDARGDGDRADAHSGPRPELHPRLSPRHRLRRGRCRGPGRTSDTASTSADSSR